jgi:hypothetical protein
MDSHLDLQIIHYDEDRIPNPLPGGVSWRLYHTVRNAVVRACRTHGPTGPRGCLPTGAPDWDKAEAKWGKGDRDPVFWVVDDQYNEKEAYLYLEILRPRSFSKEWLADVVQALRQFPGWGIGVSNIRGGYVLIFRDRIMVQGHVFRDCQTPGSVLACARQHFFR